MPEVRAGKLMPTMSEMSATTTNSSMSVTPWRSRAPRLVLPTGDVRIIAVSAGLAIQAVAQNVGIIAMLAGIFVHIGTSPGIVLDVLLQIGPLPVVDIFRFDAQRLQALLGGRVHAGVELVRTERSHVSVDLCASGGAAGTVGLADHLRKHQRREQGDDGNHYHHFNQRHTGLAAA